MEQRRLKKEYTEYGFIKSQLEECLGFKLEQDGDFLPDYLRPYKTRIGIQLREAANIMAGCKPMDTITKQPEFEIVGGFIASLWDAVDHDVLSGTDEVIEHGYNESYRVDITLLKDEVTEWAKKHDIKWPFNLTNKNNIEVLDNSAELIQKLTAEKKSLENELANLRGQLPILLGRYRHDDPLLIAIQLRNSEWSNYDEDNRKTIPNQEALITQIKEQYKSSDMKDVQARAIEKVACPIQR